MPSRFQTISIALLLTLVWPVAASLRAGQAPPAPIHPVGPVTLAATALQNSADLEPDRPSTAFLLALARLGQHRFEDARVLLKKVPESDPYYKMAQERLKQLLQR